MIFRERHWDTLLSYLKEGSLVPVVGRELTRVAGDDGRRIPFDLLLARRFAAAERLAVPEDAARFFTEQRTRFEQDPEAEERLMDLHQKLVAAVPMPPALRRLVEIEAFPFFVTTTIHNLLARSLRERSPAGAQGLGSPNGARTVETLRSTRDRPCDLPDSWAVESRRYVVHLFGGIDEKSSAFARTDEDLLEYLLQLREPEYKPRVLFDELRKRHLLFLGNSFPDWFARLFHRTLRDLAFTDVRRPSGGAVVDSAFRGGADENSLVFFFEQFSNRTMLYSGNPAAFVRELSRRWRARLAAEAAASASASETADDRMAEGAIFISYASEDAEAAAAIFRQLQAEGLVAWLDKARLRGGEKWRPAIQDNIVKCDLFMPVFSHASEKRGDGVFIKEWKQALERFNGMKESRPFLYPVLIDPLSPNEMPSLRREFQDCHATLGEWHIPQALGGQLSEKIIAELRAHLMTIRASQNS